MVKVPETMLIGDPVFLEDRKQFLHDYGTIFAHWSAFELALEVTFMRLTGVSPRQASIIFGGLNFGSRSSIVQCLANEAGKPEFADAIVKVVNLARRNALAHGAFGSEPETRKFAFFTREVKASYTVKNWEFTKDEFHKHFLKMREALDQAFHAMGVSEQDIEKYGRAAGIVD